MKKNKIILYSILTILSAALVIWFSGILSPEPPPNIVLIVIDAIRADKLGCYGFEGKISPEIDAMAKESVLFENVISQCSWTRPSIGSMITSRYPRELGIFKEKFDILNDKDRTLAEVLKENGYYTFGITANPNINKLFNFHQGFDDYQDSNVIWKWMNPQDGQKRSDDETHLAGAPDIFAKTLEKAKAIEKGPTFIQINIMDVHSPFHLLRKEYEKYFNDYPVKEVHFRYSKQKLIRLVRNTLAAVRQSSADLDGFIEKLRAIPGWENTLFIITSDHGQGLDDHPDVEVSSTHGNLLYESQLDVPLIFYHPGRKRKFSPKRLKTPVRLLDLMPTILDYAGVSVPEKNKMHGVSLLPLMKGSEKGQSLNLPDYFVAETNWRDANKISVYSKEWKYIENRDGWKGVNKIEMQPMGMAENGMITDKISENIELSKRMKGFLIKWEREHKRAKPSSPKGKLSKEESDQLKSLGDIEQRLKIRDLKIGALLRKTRKEKDLSMTEVSEKIQITTYRLKSYETGKFSVPIAELEALLDITL